MGDRRFHVGQLVLLVGPNGLLYNRIGTVASLTPSPHTYDPRTGLQRTIDPALCLSVRVEGSQHLNPTRSETWTVLRVHAIPIEDPDQAEEVVTDKELVDERS